MKREIKFRAWTGESMLLPKNIDYTERVIDLEGNQYTERDGIEWDSFVSVKEPWVLMQYTGLEDKNGKEIYEGDVVRVPENTGGGNLTYKSFIGEIRFDAPDFYVNQSANISKTGKWCGQYYRWDELEIIGNIYENPELMKKK